MKDQALIIFLTIAIALTFALACNSSSNDKDSDNEGDDDEGDDGTVDDDDEIMDQAQLYSFGDTDDGFDPDWNQENCPPYECAGNTPPALADPLFQVNGLQVPDLGSVSPGDEVRIFIGYEDAECNLACGSYSSYNLRPDIESDSTASLPSNLPCDTASSGLYLGFYYSSVIAGDYDYMLFVNDYCGAESNRIEGSFTVQ